MIKQEEILDFAREAGISEEESRQYFLREEALELEEEKALKPLFEKLVLPAVELGAGAGEFTAELLQKYIKPSGKLFAVERLDTTATKLKEKIQDSRLEVVQSDSTKLPLPDGSAGLVISRVALHDFVSQDGDVAKALADCIRVLAPGGVFVVYDKIKDGFDDVETQSAEGRMERMNVQLAALEGKVCWGLHRLDDYVALLGQLGLGETRSIPLNVPDTPGYARIMSQTLTERRAAYIKRWGLEAGKLIDSVLSDFSRIPPKALSRMIVWGNKP
jgi:ubiquinone/menaquinone biosynthesis C-methylase UbiE